MSWNETKPAEDAGGPPATSTYVRSFCNGVDYNTNRDDDVDTGLRAALEEIGTKMDVEHYFNVTASHARGGKHKQGSLVVIVAAGEQALTAGQVGVDTNSHLLYFHDGVSIKYPADDVVTPLCTTSFFPIGISGTLDPVLYGLKQPLFIPKKLNKIRLFIRYKCPGDNALLSILRYSDNAVLSTPATTTIPASAAVTNFNVLIEIDRTTYPTEQKAAYAFRAAGAPTLSLFHMCFIPDNGGL